MFESTSSLVVDEASFQSQLEMTTLLKTINCGAMCMLQATPDHFI